MTKFYPTKNVLVQKLPEGIVDVVTRDHHSVLLTQHAPNVPAAGATGATGSRGAPRSATALPHLLGLIGLGGGTAAAAAAAPAAAGSAVLAPSQEVARETTATALAAGATTTPPLGGDGAGEPLVFERIPEARATLWRLLQQPRDEARAVPRHLVLRQGQHGVSLLLELPVHLANQAKRTKCINRDRRWNCFKRKKERKKERKRVTRFI